MRDLLTLTQWMSPAFPVGAFAFSSGLETAIADGRVRDGRQLERWLADLLDFGAARSDVVLLALAYRRTDCDTANTLAYAVQSSFERREEMRQLGSAFCRTVRDVWGLELPDLAYPVAVGRAAALRDLDLADTAGLYAQSFATNLILAAVRLVPLGQTEGQRVLARLQDQCAALGAKAPELTEEDLSNETFLADIVSMRHETLSPRIFQS